jgi:ERCC4-type nuclease
MVIKDKILIDGKIRIDNREGKRKQKVIDFFGSENCVVEQLTTGDYIYDDKVCIEYKNVKTDLFSSITNKRLFRQVSRMIQEFPIHYILIQGKPIEHVIKMQMKKKKNPGINWDFTVKQWNGAYTSLCQVTQVVFANNLTHAILLMNLLFKKSTDNKNRVYNYMEKFQNPAVTYLSCINGIGQSKSELICESLELQTLNDLLSLNNEDLLNVKGIGKKTVDKILGAIIND